MKAVWTIWLCLALGLAPAGWRAASVCPGEMPAACSEAAGTDSSAGCSCGEGCACMEDAGQPVDTTEPRHAPSSGGQWDLTAMIRPLFRILCLPASASIAFTIPADFQPPIGTAPLFQKECRYQL